MSRETIKTDRAPPPAGHYCQAVRASGNFVFLAGQTPRTAAGDRLIGAEFADQARQTLDNLKAVTEAAGLTLADAVKVNVYLRRLDDKEEFDRIYAEYFIKPSAVRTLTQSNFVDFDIEIDAILLDRS